MESNHISLEEEKIGEVVMPERRTDLPCRQVHGQESRTARRD
jgi:hypothetical protein